jgi:16S rRNA (guanine(1405)-N(7))-methyltransferase
MNLEELVSEIQSSARYRAIAPQLVRRIATQEMNKRRSFKETVKEARARLHQVGSAYQEGGLDMARWARELPALPHDPSEPILKAWCSSAMRQHASTRERLPIMDEFFRTTLAGIAPLRSVLDLACGLNPLSLGWLPMAVGAPYYGCEIYPELVDFLNLYLAHIGRPGRVEVLDLLDWVSGTEEGGQPGGSALTPAGKVRLALLLKTLPCLEQVEKGVSLPLLDGIQAEYLLVSFPVRSLGGRAKGMPRTYEENFRELISSRSWTVERFEFSSELAFLVHKGED